MDFYFREVRDLLKYEIKGQDAFAPTIYGKEVKKASDVEAVEAVEATEEEMHPVVITLPTLSPKMVLWMLDENKILKLLQSGAEFEVPVSSEDVASIEAGEESTLAGPTPTEQAEFEQALEQAEPEQVLEQAEPEQVLEQAEPETGGAAAGAGLID